MKKAPAKPAAPKKAIKSIARPAEKKEQIKKIELMNFADQKPASVVKAPSATVPVVSEIAAAVPKKDDLSVAAVIAENNAFAQSTALNPFAGFSPVSY